MLRTDYSFDQFIALSQRQPYLNPYDSEFYYRLEMIELGDGPYSYPVFKVGQTHIIDFPTFDSAIYYMEKQSKEMILYRSRITQCPLFKDVEKRGAQWLYDQNGKLLDFTVVQKIGSPEETHFFGRPTEQLRFQPGDIAEILIEDEVHLVLVIAPIHTPEECWKIYDKIRSGYDLDYSSDSYTILKDDEGHISFAIATALMRPRFPITPEVKAKLESRYDAMLESALKGENPTVKMIPIVDDNDKASDKNRNPYGDCENPPYSLYLSDNSKWGLIDGSGNKLEAVFKRGRNDCFSRVPWEVVSFNPQEGFELVAWSDPGEAWFNFTFDNPAYPVEYTALLWEKPKKDVRQYSNLIYELIPTENHWLIDEILREDELMKKDDDDFYWAIDSMLLCHQELEDPAITNPMMEPVMRNPEVDKDVKAALWRAKVSLDSHIRTYKEDYPDGM